jgi:hypothetical protein
MVCASTCTRVRQQQQQASSHHSCVKQPHDANGAEGAGTSKGDTDVCLCQCQPPRRQTSAVSSEQAATCQTTTDHLQQQVAAQAISNAVLQLTFTPRAMSSGLANSSGRWDHPLRQGMKIMAVGATCGDRRGTMINNTRCGTAGM